MRCFEYFNCPKKECPAYDTADLPCWEIDGTMCHNTCRQVLKQQGQDEKKACLLCIYYRERHYLY